MKSIVGKAWSRMHGLRYRKKLILVLCFVALIPLVGASIVNASMVSTQVYERENTQVQSNMARIAYSMDAMLTGIQGLMDSIYLNSELAQALLIEDAGKSGTVYVEYVYPVLRQARTLSSIVTGLSVILPAQSALLPNGREIYRLDEKETQKDYYRALYHQNKGLYWENVRQGDGSYLLTVYRRLNYFFDAGVLHVEIPEQYLYDNFIGREQAGQYYICTAQHQVLSSNDRSAIGKPLPAFLMQSVEKGITTSEIRFAPVGNGVLPGCYVLVRTQAARAMLEILRWNGLYQCSALAALGVIVLLSMLLLRKDMRKIESLSDSLSRVVRGDYSGKVQFEGQDELTQLGKNYDQMLVYLNHLIEETYEKGLKIAQYEVEQKQASLTMLQNQIHPHFLYNTLDTIRMLAVLNDNAAVEDSLVALGNYFKYNVGFASSSVQLRDELANLADYIALINIRRNVPIQLNHEVDDSLLSQSVIRFTLQPILENAVKHGFGKSMGGIVHISATCADNAIHIMIDNNGKKIAKTELQQLNARLENGETSSNNDNVGLLNINKRIHLKYGTAYGVRLCNINSGVRVTVTLPYEVNIA